MLSESPAVGFKHEVTVLKNPPLHSKATAAKSDAVTEDNASTKQGSKPNKTTEWSSLSANASEHEDFTQSSGLDSRQE